MKLLVLIGSFLILTLSSKAQFNLSIGAGYSWNRTGAAEAFAGYNTPLINFSAGFQAHTTTVVKNGLVMQLRAGHDFNIDKSVFITPFAGFAYHYLSADDKNLNSSKVVYGLQISKAIVTKFDDNIRFYLSQSKTGEYYFLTVGVMGLF